MTMSTATITMHVNMSSPKPVVGIESLIYVATTAAAAVVVVGVGVGVGVGVVVSIALCLCHTVIPSIHWLECNHTRHLQNPPKREAIRSIAQWPWLRLRHLLPAPPTHTHTITPSAHRFYTIWLRVPTQ
jgi:MFS superfamily sulfate permease-like transporter